MKKILIGGLLILSIAFVGCGSTATVEPQISETVEETPSNVVKMDHVKSKDAELLDKGYTVISDNGRVYITYGVHMSNPNKDVAIEYPELEFVSRAEDGTVLDTKTVEIKYIAPGDDIYLGDYFGYEGEAPYTIDVGLKTDPDWFKTPSDEYASSAMFDTRDMNVTVDGSSIKVTGDIINKTDKPFDYIYTSAIFKKDGEIVGGAGTFFHDFEANGSEAFEIYTISDFPEFDTVEVYSAAP